MFKKEFNENYLIWLCRPNIPKLESIILRNTTNIVLIDPYTNSFTLPEMPTVTRSISYKLQKCKASNISTVQLQDGYAALNCNRYNAAYFLLSQYPFAVHIKPCENSSYKPIRKEINEVFVLFGIYVYRS